MKTLILTFSTCLLVVPAQAQYGGGSGTANDPYQIWTAEQMNAIGANPDDWDKHFKVMADIDLSAFTGTSFNIIGYYREWDDNKPFTGVFDGNGKRIANFSYTSTDRNYVGLFGYVNGWNAEIRDLRLIHANINAGTGDYVGSVVGHLENGTITRCYVAGGSVSGGVSVGGLVGAHKNLEVGHLNPPFTISTCCSTSSVRGEYSVGGLVGSNDRTVSNCYATGSVSGKSCVGGLVGGNGGMVTRCYSTGAVDGSDSVGGLVGSPYRPAACRDIPSCYGVATECFWDIQSSGQTAMCGSKLWATGCEDTQGKATAQMQMASTFLEAGWDFVGESVNGTDDIWWILEGRSYPRLWWQYGRAFSAHPQDGAVDVTQPLILSWIAGGSNLHHDVYFGENEQAVANATTESADIYRGRQAADVTTYEPGTLELDKTYYWRIDGVDEADANSPWKGNVWNFTTANFIVVDDFEAYDDYCNRIFYAWLDGLGYPADPECGVTAHPGNGTGWNKGPWWPPVSPFFVEQDPIVHGGSKSMSGDYDNTGTCGVARYSETRRAWDTPQDWAREGVKALTLWVHGDPCNSPEPLYVAVEDSMGKIGLVQHDDANAVQLPGWHEWNIDLRKFSNAGVDVKSVKKMYIGVGNRSNPQAGGTGKLYIDDIRLYRPRCVPSLLKPEADLSGNCVVDLADIEILAGQWLQSGPGITADLDADKDVDLGDFAQIADAWLEQLLWPQP